MGLRAKLKATFLVFLLASPLAQAKDVLSNVPGWDVLSSRAIIIFADLDLLDWMWRSASRPSEDLSGIEKYNRVKHFGSWVRPVKGECENTRAWVLLRDSNRNVPITYGPNGCSVIAGLWHDPYTATDISRADREIQIDHLVPLHHAYQHGAYKWTRAQRCHYGNFMANNYHLLSVSGLENMRKSDRGPDSYMPPNQEFQCRYLSIWLKVKAVWRLKIDREEAAFIDNKINELACEAREFRFSAHELERQVSASNNIIEACDNDSTYSPNPTVH